MGKWHAFNGKRHVYKKEKNKAFLPILIFGTAVFIFLFLANNSKNNMSIGQKLDSYKGVIVYYNGKTIAESHGKSISSNGYIYGSKWQCVEYIKRFYFLVKSHIMPDTYGNAKDYFSKDTPQGAVNKDRGLNQYRNMGDEPPKEDDILVFTAGKYGHVAIVTKINDKSIEIIQQNMVNRTRDILKFEKVNGKYIIGDKWKPACWLRKN